MLAPRFIVLTDAVVPLCGSSAAVIVQMPNCHSCHFDSVSLTSEMESDNKEDFEDTKALCRICLTQIATFKDILNETIENVSVLDMFNSITDFKVRF